VRVEVTGMLPKAFGLTRADVKRAAAAFGEASGARVGRPIREIVVHLVRDAESDAFHRAVIGVAGATDVITQGYDAVPPEKPGVYGELFVNTDQAVRAAPKRRGWDIAHELLLYIAHGADHLSGADDASEADYLRMRRRELGWLKEFFRHA